MAPEDVQDTAQQAHGVSGDPIIEACETFEISCRLRAGVDVVEAGLSGIEVGRVQQLEFHRFTD